MTFLPIVARELRVAARRPATHRARWGAALGLIAIGTWFFLIYRWQPQQRLGVGLFWMLTAVVVLYCLVMGVSSTADCLSEEKREETLGLLFLTDLNGWDVVLGKLVATSVNALYAVLAAVPILALPLLMGGVTPGAVGRMTLVALDTLFFSLALGLCVSAMSRSQIKATAGTFALIVLFAGILPACGALLYAAGKTPEVNRGWLLTSAGYAYYCALDQAYAIRPERFWQSVAVMHALGWLFLLLASAIAPRSWQGRAGGPSMLRPRQWNCGGAQARGAFRARLLDRNAYFWLASRARWKPACVWAVLGGVAGAWVYGLARFRADLPEPDSYLLTGLLLSLVLKVWFAFEAGRQLGEDHKEGALELLLSTPLTVREILRGQRLALQRQFQWPVAVVLLAFFLFMMLGASDTMFRQNPGASRLWCLFWSGGLVKFVPDLAALYWLGLWRGLNARHPVRAATESLACILLLPLGLLALVVMMAFFGWLKVGEAGATEYFLLVWLGSSLGVDLGFGFWARRKLLKEFRLAAARRYERTPGFWQRLRRMGGKGPGVL